MEKKDIQAALGYIEAHLEEPIEEPLSLAQAAKEAHFSQFHFSRMFGILCGMQLGEYIRRRRLSRAALDLKRGENALDVALKYGYSSAESFSRAFVKFHGVKPTEAKRGAPVKNFAPIDIIAQGESNMSCEIKELPAKTLVGFKAHFRGVAFGEDRLRQEHAFFESTRGRQWLLFGAGGGRAEEYAVVSDVTKDGYNFFIAYELDEWARRAIFDPATMGIDTRGCGFEIIALTPCRAAVFTTQKSIHPIADFSALRASIVQAADRYDFEFAEAPERVIYHWHLPQREERYIEICLPIV